MTNFNPALNYNFAAAEAARLAYAERGAEETVAAQLRQATAAQDKFTIGSTITARYQYKVAEDGSLVPLQTQITTDAPDEKAQGEGSQRRSRQPSRDATQRQPTFSDLSWPKPLLTPTDEMALFASTSQDNIPASVTGGASNLPHVLTTGEATISVAEVTDESGAPVQAEIIAPQTSQAQAAANILTPSAQYSVASLYARNNDVVYNVTPIAMLAA